MLMPCDLNTGPDIQIRATLTTGRFFFSLEKVSVRVTGNVIHNSAPCVYPAFGISLRGFS